MLCQAALRNFQPNKVQIFCGMGILLTWLSTASKMCTPQDRENLDFVCLQVPYLTVPPVKGYGVIGFTVGPFKLGALLRVPLPFTSVVDERPEDGIELGVPVVVFGGQVVGARLPG